MPPTLFFIALVRLITLILILSPVIAAIFIRDHSRKQTDKFTKKIIVFWLAGFLFLILFSSLYTVNKSGDIYMYNPPDIPITEEFSNTIRKGDSYFEQGQYEDALSSYQYAQKLLRRIEEYYEGDGSLTEKSPFKRKGTSINSKKVSQYEIIASDSGWQGVISWDNKAFGILRPVIKN